MSSEASRPGRVVIVAPTGSDSRNIDGVLRRCGLATHVCASIVCATEQADADCGALLVAEEAISPADRELLATMVRRQPPWSDLPIILITSGRDRQTGDPRRLIGGQGNISLLERPLHIATLIASVDVALRSRRRQFELRDLLAEREKLLTSLEGRVAERTAKLQAMVTEMEAFSYSVSHDLRSPLRVLAGYAHALREDHATQLDEQGKVYLEKIARAAERMDRLTQDLLAYTRIAGSELAIGPVDLDDVVHNVIETYPAIRDAKGHIRVREPLGTVYGHAPSLVQCFSNLLDNALKFATPGQPPQVEVGAERHGPELRCYVRDHGPGIERADLERIFGLFERATDRRVPGTGVGLAIVKKAAERMKGAVGVESTRGAGTTFWIQLRAARADEKRA